MKAAIQVTAAAEPEEEPGALPPKHLRLLIACKTGDATAIDAALTVLERDSGADDAMLARDPQGLDAIACLALRGGGGTGGNDGGGGGGGGVDPDGALAARLLALGGADPCAATSASGNTPLHLAAMRGSVGVLRAMLSVPAAAGAAVAPCAGAAAPSADPRNANGGTPLMNACHARRADCAALLLEFGGADPCARTREGLTPLILALEAGSGGGGGKTGSGGGGGGGGSCWQLLLQHGARTESTLARMLSACVSPAGRGVLHAAVASADKDAVVAVLAAARRAGAGAEEALLFPARHARWWREHQRLTPGVEEAAVATIHQLQQQQQQQQQPQGLRRRRQARGEDEAAAGAGAVAAATIAGAGGGAGPPTEPLAQALARAEAVDPEGARACAAFLRAATLEAERRAHERAEVLLRAEADEAAARQQQRLQQQRQQQQLQQRRQQQQQHQQHQQQQRQQQPPSSASGVPTPTPATPAADDASAVSEPAEAEAQAEGGGDDGGGDDDDGDGGDEGKGKQEGRDEGEEAAHLAPPPAASPSSLPPPAAGPSSLWTHVVRGGRAGRAQPAAVAGAAGAAATRKATAAAATAPARPEAPAPGAPASRPAGARGAAGSTATLPAPSAWRQQAHAPPLPAPAPSPVQPTTTPPPPPDAPPPLRPTTTLPPPPDAPAEPAWVGAASRRMARDCPAAAALELHPRHLCGVGLGGGGDEGHDEEGEGDEDEGEGGKGGGGGGGEEGALSVAQLEALEHLHLAALRRVARLRAEEAQRLRANEKAARGEHEQHKASLLSMGRGR